MVPSPKGCMRSKQLAIWILACSQYHQMNYRRIGFPSEDWDHDGSSVKAAPQPLHRRHHHLVSNKVSKQLANYKHVKFGQANIWNNNSFCLWKPLRNVIKQFWRHAPKIFFCFKRLVNLAKFSKFWQMNAIFINEAVVNVSEGNSAPEEMTNRFDSTRICAFVFKKYI